MSHGTVVKLFPLIMRSQVRFGMLSEMLYRSEVWGNEKGVCRIDRTRASFCKKELRITWNESNEGAKMEIGFENSRGTTRVSQ